jgi:hypothetical protein
VSATDASGAEAGANPIVITVTRGGNIWSSIVVNLGWSGTASLGSDYTVSATGGTLSGNNLTLTLAPGVTSATVTLMPVDDVAVESTETATLTLASGTGYTVGSPSSASGSIVDNDAAAVVGVTATDGSGAETGPDPIVFTVTRTGSTAAITINLGWSGGAAYGTDYTVSAGGGTLSGNGLTLTLAAGATGATVTVTPVDDAAIESSETVVLTLASGSGYTLGSPSSATGSILDNDTPATVTVAATDASGAEAASDQVVFTVTRTVNTATQIVVNLAWSGTAGLTTDYTVSATGGTLSTNGLQLTLAPGATSATVRVTPIDDAVYEGAEGVTLTLASGTGYTVGSPSSATGSIADNDAAPVIAVTATDAAGAEQGLDAIVFSVTRTSNLNGSLAVGLTWSGTATLGTDYTVAVTGGTLSGSTLTLASGSAGATITLTPVDDTAVEGAETVVLTLATGTGYTLGSPSSAGGSIADNDVRTISVADATVTEGDKQTSNVSVTVTLSAASTSTVTVVATTVAGSAVAGSDFQSKTATLTFAAGVTSMTFVVAIVGDRTSESTETFTVVLSSSNGAAIGDGSGTVTIVDNDSHLLADAAASTPSGAALSAGDVPAALAWATAQWSAAGIDTSALRGVRVVVADLPGLTLGQADGLLITVDSDAAGWGWSLDGRSPGIDLREVLEHELGHVLGFSHDDDAQFAVMAETLHVTPSSSVDLPALHTGVVVTLGALRPAITILRGLGSPLTLRPAAHARIANHTAVKHRLRHCLACRLIL